MQITMTADVKCKKCSETIAYDDSFMSEDLDSATGTEFETDAENYFERQQWQMIAFNNWRCPAHKEPAE